MLGELIKDIRKTFHLTQQQMADILCLDVSSISSYECNVNTPPVYILKELARQMDGTILIHANKAEFVTHNIEDIERINQLSLLLNSRISDLDMENYKNWLESIATGSIQEMRDSLLQNLYQWDIKDVAYLGDEFGYHLCRQLDDNRDREVYIINDIIERLNDEFEWIENEAADSIQDMRDYMLNNLHSLNLQAVGQFADELGYHLCQELKRTLNSEHHIIAKIADTLNPEYRPEKFQHYLEFINKNSDKDLTYERELDLVTQAITFKSKLESCGY